jgi:hypothetical protein
MQEGLKVNVNDMISFFNTSSGTKFKARVKKNLKNQVFVLEIIESDKPQFIGTTKELDFAAPHNYSRIEILEIEPFEDGLAKYEAAKYFNNCLLAVDTNDKEWFNDSFAQYTLWNSKIKQEEGPNNEKSN